MMTATRIRSMALLGIAMATASTGMTFCRCCYCHHLGGGATCYPAPLLLLSWLWLSSSSPCLHLLREEISYSRIRTDNTTIIAAPQQQIYHSHLDDLLYRSPSRNPQEELVQHQILATNNSEHNCCSESIRSINTMESEESGQALQQDTSNSSINNISDPQSRIPLSMAKRRYDNELESSMATTESESQNERIRYLGLGNPKLLLDFCFRRNYWIDIVAILWALLLAVRLIRTERFNRIATRQSRRTTELKRRTRSRRRIKLWLLLACCCCTAMANADVPRATDATRNLIDVREEDVATQFRNLKEDVAGLNVHDTKDSTSEKSIDLDAAKIVGRTGSSDEQNTATASEPKMTESNNDTDASDSSIKNSNSVMEDELIIENLEDLDTINEESKGKSDDWDETLSTADLNIEEALTKKQTSPSLVLCTVDGSILIVDAYSGMLRNGFSSGMPLVGASSSLEDERYGDESESDDDMSTGSSSSNSDGSSGDFSATKSQRKHYHRRIVPGLNGRLYLSLTETDEDSEDAILQPLAITILDVLQNPVKTCHTPTDCGIVTATKATSLFALDAYTGKLLWRQDSDGKVVKSNEAPSSVSSPAVLLQREDVLVRQLSTVSGNQVWNVTLGTFQALEFGESAATNESEQNQGRHRDQSDMLLLDGPVDDSPNDSFTTGDSNDTPLLPSVIFGPDGLSVTAVDPTDNLEVLWHHTFPTVVASAFGLSGTEWKPLTVVTEGDGNEPVDEDETDEKMDKDNVDYTNDSEKETGLSITRIGENNNRKSAFLPHSHTNGRNRLQNMNQWENSNGMSTEVEISATRYPDFYKQQLESHMAFMRMRQRAEEFYRDHGKYHPYDCLVPGVCGQLQLPAPRGSTDVAEKPEPTHHINYELVDKTTQDLDDTILSFLKDVYYYPLASRGIFRTPSGLFMSWPLMASVVVAAVVVCIAVAGLLYQRKKKQWIANVNAQIASNSPRVSFDSDALQSFKRTNSNDGDSRNSSSRFLRRSQSMPLVPNKDGTSDSTTQPFLLEPSPDLNSSPSRIRKNSLGSDVDDTKPTASSTAIVATSSSSPSQPLPPQGVGVIDGIPLIRYSRYDSEFQEQTALGKGGFGTVFKCQNALDGRQYAIKKVFIKHDPSLPNEFSRRLKRVLREVKILAVLDHPNIVRYYTAWLELEQGNGNSKAPVSDDSYEDLSTEPTPAQRTARARRYSTDLLANSFSTMDRARISRNRFHNKDDSYINPLGWNNQNSMVSLDEDSLDFSCSQSHSQICLDDCGFTFDRSGEPSTANAATPALPAIEESNEKNSGSDRNMSLNSVLGDVAASSYPSAGAEQSPSWSQDDDSDEPQTETRAESKLESKTVASATQSTQPAPPALVRHTLYIQMQLCSQKTLGDFLADKEVRRGPTGGCNDIDIPYALSLFLQIAQGVTYVHGRGLIHRDLKPNNCFMDDTGTVKVGDFGLSRESGDNIEQGDETETMVAVLDDTNGDNTAGVGTRSYASPEQMSGSDYDSSTDVYSLGIILFELCYPMYTGMERYIVFSKLRKGEFPEQWMKEIVVSYPILHPLLLSMISTQPSERPTADTVVRKIRSILEQFTITSLDRYKYEGLVLLRVEAKPLEDVLRRTMDILHSAALPFKMDIVQYGLRGGTNKTIMEFAIASLDEESKLSNFDATQSLGPRIVAKAMESPDVLLVRQVSGTKYT